MVGKDCGRICFAFAFACVVDKIPKNPNLSPMADDAITWGSIQGLGSPVYICGYEPILHACFYLNGGSLNLGLTHTLTIMPIIVRLHIIN